MSSQIERQIKMMLLVELSAISRLYNKLDNVLLLCSEKKVLDGFMQKMSFKDDVTQDEIYRVTFVATITLIQIF